MAVLIIDTNIWVTASGRSDMPSECAERVRRFVTALKCSDDRLALDHAGKILAEYRKNIRNEQDVAYPVLILLYAKWRFDVRLIEFDVDGIAIVPPGCAIHDLSDRKFVAVSLAHEAHPPIHNASDEDWLEDEELLATCGVQVVHHCEAELRRRYQEKRLAAGKRQWTETIPREGLTQ